LALHVTAKAKGGRGISEHELGNALRVAYRKEDFVLTKLFDSLKQWEQSSGYALFAD
jgi:hypothetical protein